MSAKTSSESIHKYMAKAYDRLEILLKKGKKDLVRAHAASKGMSLNGYINDLIDKDMSNNNPDQ